MGCMLFTYTFFCFMTKVFTRIEVFTWRGNSSVSDKFQTIISFKEKRAKTLNLKAKSWEKCFEF